MHSTKSLLEVRVFPLGNKFDIDWYMRMPTDPYLDHPKAGLLLEQCDEGYAILESTFPMTDSQLPH